MPQASGRHQGFTLIELLVVISVIVILASMAMPVVMDSMRRAARVECLSNLKQLGIGNMLYMKDYSGFLPCYGDAYASTVNPNYYAPSELVRPYVDHPSFADPQGKPAYAKRYRLFICPVDPNPENFWLWHLAHPTVDASSYMWNEHTMTITTTVPYPSIRAPVESGLIADGWACPNGWTWTTCAPPGYYPYSRCDWEHDGGVNMLYADQHIDKVRHYDVAKVRSDVR